MSRKHIDFQDIIDEIQFLPPKLLDRLATEIHRAKLFDNVLRSKTREDSFLHIGGVADGQMMRPHAHGCGFHKVAKFPTAVSYRPDDAESPCEIEVKYDEYQPECIISGDTKFTFFVLSGMSAPEAIARLLAGYKEQNRQKRQEYMT